MQQGRGKGAVRPEVDQRKGGWVVRALIDLAASVFQFMEWINDICFTRHISSGIMPYL